ncbi:hypothetical protein I3842_15G130500 [Carya illinoinensis]|uniref:Uncharacterized protein n=1 Tax=Carya illinoinensis TaxID=32201 RepID=A0A922AD85_CARIL|nr:hypothetical protein I3842_15G130500 [Carya illinoinensis]
MVRPVDPAAEEMLPRARLEDLIPTLLIRSQARTKGLGGKTRSLEAKLGIPRAILRGPKIVDDGKSVRPSSSHSSQGPEVDFYFAFSERLSQQTPLSGSQGLDEGETHRVVGEGLLKQGGRVPEREEQVPKQAERDLEYEEIVGSGLFTKDV